MNVLLFHRTLFRANCDNHMVHDSQKGIPLWPRDLTKKNATVLGVSIPRLQWSQRALIRRGETGKITGSFRSLAAPTFGECGDVDQAGNAVIGSRGCDDGSAV